MRPRLPFEIREAVVAVCGKCFWLKDPFRTFLLACGVPPELYDRYADESKYKIAGMFWVSSIASKMKGTVFNAA